MEISSFRMTSSMPENPKQKRQPSPASIVTSPEFQPMGILKDHTFIAAAFEYESESGQEWSEVPQSAVAAINRALT
jgi:hypothetical protein